MRRQTTRWPAGDAALYTAGAGRTVREKRTSMHASSMENMEKCYDRYVRDSDLARRAGAVVLDVGGSDVNGSYRSIFPAPPFDYLGCDLQAGPGVSIVQEDPYRIPLESASVDIVLSGQMLEHCEFFWLAFAEMMRVLKADGLMFLIVPSAGPIHRFPVDCYRFYPDSFAALAKHAKCHLVECWLDERGPWNDLVGVFSWEPRARSTRRRRADVSGDLRYQGGSPREEAVRGADQRLEALAHIHAELAPSLYLEIGVRFGRSLRLARGRAVGVDPAPAVEGDLPPSTVLIESTSDDFFEHETEALLGAAPDMVMIDGRHLFEYALRDFMNAEKMAAPHGLIVIDDIFPNHARQATRKRETRVWAGDVWKLHAILREHRPDLYLLPLDASPAGLLLVAGLNARDRVLWKKYNPIVKAYRDLEAPPRDVVERQGAVCPQGDEVAGLLETLKQARTRGLKRQRIASRLGALRR